MTLDDYKAAGFWPTLISTGIVFVGAWGYCVATSGFLLGFGLGWLPAGIAAALTHFLMRWLWGPVLVAAALLIASLIYFSSTS